MRIVTPQTSHPPNLIIFNIISSLKGKLHVHGIQFGLKSNNILYKILNLNMCFKKDNIKDPFLWAVLFNWFYCNHNIFMELCQQVSAL